MLSRRGLSLSWHGAKGLDLPGRLVVQIQIVCSDVAFAVEVLLKNERASVADGMHDGCVIRRSHDRPVARLVESCRRELQDVARLDLIQRDAVTESVTFRRLSSGGPQCLVSEVPAFSAANFFANVVGREVDDLTLNF